MKINMADWEEYFSKQTAPANLKETKTIVAEFAANHRAAGRNVVLITSGGTAVPLESNTVRFIDNFSSGTRGAASAEQFLQQGYAVIFLFRQHSLQPFSRHISPDSFLDILEFKGDNEGSLHIEVDESRAPNIRDVLKKYHEVQVLGTLLLVEFNTLSDYLFLLRTMAEALGNLGSQVMFYLAAAVSDFYIPEESMSEHKIQSDCGPLELVMQQVPKMLTPLVKEWAENAFVVSFKLETDVNIISKKAREALTKYNHQVVVSNILQTRKKTVVIVTPAHEMAVWMSDEELEQGKEIEAKIVTELIKMHHRFISGSTIQGTHGQFIPGQLQQGVPHLPQVQQFQQYGVPPSQPPLTPQDSCSPGYGGFSPNSNTAVTHIRIRKNEEGSSPPSTSPIPEGSIPPTPTTPTSGGKGNSRFGILSDLSLTIEMKEFIESFRTRRIALGYTQEDVGFELSRTNGPSYSQSFISRFESKNLGLKAAEKMKPVMQTWLEQKEQECSKGLRVCKKRKRRTSFSNEVLRVLISYFEQNPKPSSAEISQIAKEVNLEPVTVRVWFCNRKQMLKRMATGKTRVNNSLKAELEAKSKVELSPSKEGKLDFTNMPVGQFSFTEDRVKPLVCVASEGSPVKKVSRTPTSCVTYAQVQDDTIVHSTALTGTPGAYSVSEPVNQVNQFPFPEVEKPMGMNVGNAMKTTPQTPTSYAQAQDEAINSSAGTGNHVAFSTESLSEPGTHVEHAAVVSLNFDSPVVHKVQQGHFSRPMGEENALHDYQTEVRMPEHS